MSYRYLQNVISEDDGSREKIKNRITQAKVEFIDKILLFISSNINVFVHEQTKPLILDGL